MNYTANNLNQYDSVGSVYYDYDLNGNTTFDGVAPYTYDSENRLTGATNADGTTAGPFNPAVDNMVLTFTTGGNEDWVPTRDEYYDDGATNCDSAESGVIGASQQSWLQTTVTGEGTIKFYYKKNAGTNDYFRFKVVGDIKLSIANSSASWTYYTYGVTGASSHTFHWNYRKGGSGTTANGGVWVDLVVWEPDAVIRPFWVALGVLFFACAQPPLSTSIANGR